MSADYSGDHADALQAVRDAGAPVAFVHAVAGTHDPLTETFSGSSDRRVTGQAIEVASSREEEALAANELLSATFATLLFVPDTFGGMPEIKSVVTWAGRKRTVFAVRPLRLAGTVILARVLLQ